MVTVEGKRETVPPYLPTLGWYAAYTASGSDAAAANKALGVSGKDFARAGIRGQLLSVAVEGGSGKLKGKRDISGIRLSGHGNWPHVHLGALEARYGRSPYYQHVMPGIRDILMTPPETLAELNTRLHRHLITFLQPLPATLSPTAVERGRELAKTIDPELSVIDALMNLGPDTSLILSISPESFR